MELKRVVDLVRKLPQHRYSAEINSRQSIEPIATINSLFAAMFKPQHNDGRKGDEVDQYLLIGIIQTSGFMDVLSWWSARKESMLAHYQMVVGYNGTPATSTPSERVNNAASHEFTYTR